MAKPEVTCTSSFCFFVLQNNVSTLIFIYILGLFFNKTIIPLTLVGYEMIIANLYPTRAHGIIVKYTVYLREKQLQYLKCSLYFKKL